MIVRFKKLHPAAQTPTKATDGSAGFDLYASGKVEPVCCSARYFTGVAVEIPEGYVGLLFARSSISKTPHRVANAVGVIDSDYRGEISIVFDEVKEPIFNRERYRDGDRIGQLVIVPVPKVDLIKVDELSETERGTGGYGSTGR